MAATLGVLSAVLSIATPLLPVSQDVVTISWPTARGTAPVTTPLVAYHPLSLQITVPCVAARDLDARTDGPARLVSTLPAGSTLDSGLVLQVEDGAFAVLLGGRQLGTAAVPPADCTLDVAADGAGTGVTLAGTALVDVDRDVRPQVVGIYSELGERDRTDGLSVRIEVDTRYHTTPHPAKVAAMVLAGLTLLGSLAALHLLDTRTGRNASLRLAPRGWWRLTGRDSAVLAILAGWLVIGAITVDDGYLLTMARVAAETGYLGNYYRWFDVPEAPFGWFDELYVLMAGLSATTVWMRLPAFVMGILCWGLLSRGMLPRLGGQVRRSRAAGWAAAAVFLCFWLPFNNGMRPEPVVALGSLLALCCVERAVATRRLLSAGAGLLVAGLTVAATPTGVIAVVPFLVSARPLLAMARERAATGGRAVTGWLPVLAPLLAAGLITLIVAFADQTLAAVIEATAVRTAIGPNLSWYEEPTRYWQLFGAGGGSLARQFPVVVLLLCAAACVAVSLRRGRIAGAAAGPSRRLLATVLGSLVILALTPTKWTHHFGAFAALGGALAALTALATSRGVLRSRRNRAAFLAALLAGAALAATGPNSWHYVSGLGVPWFDKPPSIRGYRASTALLIAAGLALVVAGVEHLRLDRAGAAEMRPRLRGRGLRLASAPLALVCGTLVIAEVAAMTKAMHEQRGSYSVGASTIKQVTSGGCGLSDAVLAEPDPLAGVLSPLTAAPAPAGPFRRDGLPPGADSDPTSPWRPPHGFGSDIAPVWGSYRTDGGTTGTTRTAWYRLPGAAARGELPVVVAIAGRLGADTSLVAELGVDDPQGIRVLTRVPLADVTDPGRINGPGWRDLRLELDPVTPGATAMRLVAVDGSPQADVPEGQGWFAFSAPRVPALVPMTELIGTEAPVLLEWSVAFVFPCLRPFAVRQGTAEVPSYWITAPATLQPASRDWLGADAGGPLGWLTAVASTRTVPTYLRGDWQADWGMLLRVRPYEPAAVPAPPQRRVVERWGWSSSGPMQVPGAESRSQTR